MSSQFIFYVYAYLREDLTPYYIGKGKTDRAYEKDHTVNLPVDRNRVVFLETYLSELGAFALERRMIRWYGRKDNGTGILRNRTDGGEGPIGRIPWNKGLTTSNETKLKIGAANSGRLSPKKGKDSPLKGRTISAQHKAKISATKQLQITK